MPLGSLNASPNSGLTLGGDTVNLTPTGSSFNSVDYCQFGGVNAHINFANNSQMQVITPPHAAGSVSTFVHTQFGDFVNNNGFTYVAPPPVTVTGCTPSNGPTSGGTNVTITGTSFYGSQYGPTAVTFGGVPASSFSIISLTQIAAVAPPHAAGLVDIVVSGPAGAATGTGLFTYGSIAPTVTAISPPVGSTLGGTSVTISGTHFDQGVSSVTIGGVAATGVSVVNPTTLTAFTGPHAAGLVNVIVVTAAGTGTGTGLYTYATPTPPAPPGPFFRTYLIERLNNRVWPTVEDCWCVDCGFTLEQPAPAADLLISSGTGAGVLTGVTNLMGGQNYSAATTAQVVDGNGLGPGSGATPVLTIVAGVITAISFSSGGSSYVFPNLVFNDPENTGSGASATITMNNSALFTTSTAVFDDTNIGSVIRAGYGVAVITSLVDTSNVIANLLSPVVQIQPDDPISDKPIIQLSGTWTMTVPISQLYIPQLAGFEVTGLADGQIIPPTVVSAAGILTLSRPASAIVIGLAFEAQLQTTYLDAGEPTVQGQRKKIAEATARIEQSAAFQIGSNQPDGSVQSPQELFTIWQNMVAAPTHAVAPFNSPFTPLFTGDVRIPILGGFDTKGQIAFQQLNPLPLQVLDVVPEVFGGDEPNQKFPRQASKGRQGQQQ